MCTFFIISKWNGIHRSSWTWSQASYMYTYIRNLHLDKLTMTCLWDINVFKTFIWSIFYLRYSHIFIEFTKSSPEINVLIFTIVSSFIIVVMYMFVMYSIKIENLYKNILWRNFNKTLYHKVIIDFQ